MILKKSNSEINFLEDLHYGCPSYCIFLSEKLTNIVVSYQDYLVETEFLVFYIWDLNGGCCDSTSSYYDSSSCFECFNVTLKCRLN